MAEPNRLDGGRIDRASPLTFSFDGKTFAGYRGDTLASALLAANVKLVGRSFKYHRPRGILTAGSEEPNALVGLHRGARHDPNARATTVELHDGLVAVSQNRWPSLAFDVMAVNDVLSRFLTAGFYYKTFMWPKRFWEKFYEPAIRSAAGLGALSGEPDPDRYDTGFLHCDLLVVGGGPAGLAAAMTAARSGARVILADEDFVLGGRLNAETVTLDGEPAAVWLRRALDELHAAHNVRLMPRTSVFGAYDHGVYGALERVADHLAVAPAHLPRQVLWRIRSRRAVLCAGATERPIAFANNDRPGIMLAGAMRAYANRWAVAADRTVAVFTNNDDGHRTASDLLARGVSVAAVIDARPDAHAQGNYELHRGAIVENTRGRKALTSVDVRRADGSRVTVPCGALGVSGGWNPAVALTCHQRGRPSWDASLAAFVPGADLPPGMAVAGAANGSFSTHAALQSGADAASHALAELGFEAPAAALPLAEDAPVRIQAFWHVASGKGRTWLDFQNDVTVKDVGLAVQEGFRSVEHVKRYTTLGMATDQGKLANTGAIAALADLTGRGMGETGTTMFRPPWTPVPIAAFAGRSRGKDFRPARLTPSHDWAAEQGAVFVEAGLWLRAQYFPRPGETHWRQTVDREVRAVRQAVGVCDVTTLGKVDVQGSDAAAFLNMIYCNGFSKLPVSRVRYGLMLREDGMVMDDGTAARLADDHFVVTTTTANAALVYRHMEFVRQCLRSDLDVQLVSTTEAWAQYAVAGPHARALLAGIVDPPFDLGDDAFPYMACAELTVCGGVTARLFRISFSGERAYEIAVPACYGDSLIRVLMQAGAPHGVTPYGTEALGVLRIEKGHPAGNELNGQTSPAHLSMARLVSTKKDSIGAVLSRREGLSEADGLRLVGLEAMDGETALPAGSHLFAPGRPHDPGHDEGWITSAAYSPHLGRSIALAFLARGDSRLGETIEIANPLQGQTLRATVVHPVFIDPEGTRLHG
ncbi:sarcosine oxidase subunit alpha [Zhengella mangrovi]|uniref:Sarcosine oxidase subunit alpha n=1 Tax=Zhengella mangrovi TaxID=1982044 RepID=A0A2G1QT08_9HYPH|nr:sarcosine oxidase subunit alpha family protein [Zhengella mangrovi]PHP68677.1 sarcosine oxidase subunit alpha [Zhengella mangrovi]